MKDFQPKILTQLSDEVAPHERLKVHISYQIIKLFSEGLYKSPHKALEELVSNSYDAMATEVHILMNSDDPTDSMWVVDNGTGMDEAGFERLWTIAKSEKAQSGDDVDRPPIGQFGIGKLAAYVLAQHLTHISKTSDGYFLTSMDFSRVEEKDIDEKEPLPLDLLKVTDDYAGTILQEVKERAPDLFDHLFSDSAWPTWTVAALSNFKPLGNKLKEGTLKWVLRTGLPIATNFKLFVNGDRLKSERLKREYLADFKVGEDDHRMEALQLQPHAEGGVIIPKLGRVTGIARIYPDPLTGGKSDDLYHRNNGFFIRVRERVINIEDELFGLPAQNHAAWARFYMEVTADGLRDYLLSSREGVRAEEAVETFRSYLHKTFLACRQVYDDWKTEDLKKLDIQHLLEEAPALLVSEPLTTVITKALQSRSDSLRYIRTPLPTGEPDDWTTTFYADVTANPFAGIQMVEGGAYGDLVEYNAANRSVRVNRDHPFVTRIRDYSKNDHPPKLLASVEVVSEALLHAVGVDPVVVHEYLDKRDKVLRLLAGEYPAAAPDALRYLSIANENDTALERAIGTAFEVLGFEYEKRGRNEGGTDGVLTARLGRGPTGVRTYKLVFDAKTTTKAKVKLERLRFAALHRFMQDEEADFGFFLSKAYTDQENPDGEANREARNEHLTLLRIADLERIIRLQIRFGVTLEELRRLFEQAYDQPAVREWIDEYENELSDPANQVPLLDLLRALQDQKLDEGAVPSVYVARRERESLKRFDVDRLKAVLKGVQSFLGGRWIEIDDLSGTVRLHQTPERIAAETDRLFTLTLAEEIEN